MWLLKVMLELAHRFFCCGLVRIIAWHRRDLLCISCVYTFHWTLSCFE